MGPKCFANAGIDFCKKSCHTIVYENKKSKHCEIYVSSPHTIEFHLCQVFRNRGETASKDALQEYMQPADPQSFEKWMLKWF